MMEKIKNNKTKIIKLLTQINHLRQADETIWGLTEGWKKYYVEDQLKSSWFLDWNNVLDIVYLEMIGETHQVTYDSFKTCNYDKVDKPVAWYRTQFNSDRDKWVILGPKRSDNNRYSGYIHDRIDDVILSYKLSAEKKYKLLDRMFNDLIKLKRKYDENKSKAV